MTVARKATLMVLLSCDTDTLHCSDTKQQISESGPLCVQKVEHANTFYFKIFLTTVKIMQSPRCFYGEQLLLTVMLILAF